MDDSGPLRRVLARWPDGAHLMVMDAGCALMITLAAALAVLERAAGAGAYRLDEAGWAAWLAAAAIGGPIALRRRWPLGVLNFVTGASAGALITDTVPTYAGAAPYCAVALALYLVGLAEPRRRSVTALALTLLTGVAVALVTDATIPTGYTGDPLGPAPVVVVALLLPWAVGYAIRERRAALSGVAERRAERVLADERLRIARELHDVVAHSLSLIAVKAGTANHVARERPEEAYEALQVIESTSRSALVEVRRALGVLRDDRDAPADLGPAPGLADLPALADRATAAGVPVTLNVKVPVGAMAVVPEAVGLSAYRIVQEAVTNVIRHAVPARPGAPARCAVTVTVHGSEIRIEVTDDGSAPGRPALPGHGLVGVRERVALYGGTFSAGPQPGGGFRLYATLPFEEAR